MSETKEKTFAKGFIFKRRENAPEWVVGGLSVKIDEAIEFLQQHAKNGWVNLDINKSQKGTYFVALNDFVPSNQGQGGSHSQYPAATPTATPTEVANPFTDSKKEDDLPW
jgi:hypothetical protein